MIFSIGDHIEQIKNGTKTQTRRRRLSVIVGNTYSIQPGRGKHGIPDGRIRITAVRKEWKENIFHYPITEKEADAEGGYTSNEFEELYEKMYPGWKTRYVYRFRYIPQSSSGSVKK